MRGLKGRTTLENNLFRVVLSIKHQNKPWVDCFIFK